MYVDRKIGIVSNCDVERMKAIGFDKVLVEEQI